MSNRHREPRKNGFWPLAILFAAFVLFLYGPVITIFVLSFQGPEGGLTFPMRGVSLHWYHKLWQGLGVVDIGAALRRSFALGAAVMVLTVLLSLSAGLAFRKKFRGADLLFYVTVASLIMPSIIVSLGMFTSGLGAHLTWTLPFGLLIMFAVFNRFNPAYEEAARDQGATPWQSFWHVVLPLIAPSVIGIGMFGFTLSWDEISRSSQAIGDLNTLPLELQGLTTTVTDPAIYALGTITTGVSLLVIAIALASVAWLRASRAGRSRRRAAAAT